MKTNRLVLTLLLLLTAAVFQLPAQQSEAAQTRLANGGTGKVFEYANSQAAAAPGPTAIDPSTGLPVAAPPQEAVEVGSIPVKINPALTDMRLADVLDINLPGLPSGAKKLTLLLVPGRGSVRAFFMGKYEVTQGQFVPLMRKNPSCFKTGPDYPVETVTWYEAKEFCRRLMASLPDALSGQYTFRLPTDAEWSVAVGLPEESGSTPTEKNGKIKDVYPWGTTWPPPNGAGNYHDMSWERKYWHAVGSATVGSQPYTTAYYDGYADTAPVGSFEPNQYGLCDLGGNVYELCEDWFDSRQSDRVLRGESWSMYNSDSLLSSSRFLVPPGVASCAVGFRVVLVDELSNARNEIDPYLTVAHAHKAPPPMNSSASGAGPPSSFDPTRPYTLIDDPPPVAPAQVKLPQPLPGLAPEYALVFVLRAIWIIGCAAIAVRCWSLVRRRPQPASPENSPSLPVRLKYTKRFALGGFFLSMGLLFDNSPGSPLHGAEFPLRLLGTVFAATLFALLCAVIGLITDAFTSRKKRDCEAPKNTFVISSKKNDMAGGPPEDASDNHIKTFCALCGGSIEFPAHGLGERIDCPHCNRNIELQRTQSGKSRAHITPSTSASFESMLIHITRNGKVLGPYSMEEVREHLATDSLTLSDFAYVEGGSPAWIPLASVPGILSPVNATISPPVIPPVPIPVPVQPAHRQPDATPRSASYLFGFLRFVRGACGVLFGLEVIGLVPLFTWLQQPDARTGNMWALVFIKVVALIIFGALFFWLRHLINKLHIKKHGAPHPSLAKIWAF